MVYTALFTSARALGGAYAPGGRLALALAKERGAAKAAAGAAAAALPAFSLPGFVNLVSMLATAFVCHYAAATYYEQLADKADYNKVVAGGFGGSIVLMSMIVAAGVATFGRGVAGSVLNSYAAADGLATAARAAVGAAIACTYPLLFSGLRDGIFELCARGNAARLSLIHI